MSGCTGGIPAKRGGISIIALLMSTATGFRSPASAVSPSRWASSGMAAAPGERIQDRRRPVGEAPVDLSPGLGQHVGVVGVLPFDEPLQEA